MFSFQEVFIKASEVDLELEYEVYKPCMNNDLGAGWIDHHSYYSYYSLS
jgi:hypothetical protein